MQPSLHFLGLRRSLLKKIWPLTVYFSWRDKKVYDKILSEITQSNDFLNVSNEEGIIHFYKNNSKAEIIFRKFPFSDLSVLHQIFFHKSYEPIIEKIKVYFHQDYPIKVIDAGANVGYSLMYFHLNFPNSNIIAIEPSESNCIQLQKNLTRNNFSVKQLVQGALWPDNTHLQIERNFRDNREAAFTVKESKIATSLKGYTFEELLNLQNWNEVDLLKIDIEGGERFLFDTAEKANFILERTTFLALEIHDEFGIRNEIYKHLQANGFEYFNHDDLTLALNTRKVRNEKI